MVSYADLDPNAPFAVVFSSRGMDWAAKLVAVGALFGGCDGVHGGVSRREQARVNGVAGVEAVLQSWWRVGPCLVLERNA